MSLRDLGYDEWFEEKRRGLDEPARPVARVTAVDRDRYMVRGEAGEVRAEATGRLRFSAETSFDFPAVGDWVSVQYHDDGAHAVIHELLPRRTLLSRKTSGKKTDHQLIAANIDTAFVMQACDGDFSVRRMERYLVMILEGGIAPVILLSKRDLVDDAELQDLIAQVRGAGIAADVIPFTNREEEGVEPVRALLGAGKTFCLLGSSGVGKTTLLNRLMGGAALPTAEVRERDGKGRHTTTRRQMVPLERGAHMVDTPGMRELANIGAEGGLEESFADIGDLAALCRFNDCTHTQEAGCRVIAAVESGELPEERYRSFLALARESNFHSMSYLERRRRNKRFGKMIRSVMKERKKRHE